MTSSTDINLIKSLDHISEQLNRYLSPIIFIFGTVGNLLNCLVLSQRTLRSNPCVLLFLVSSFFNFISILIGVTTRILAGWHLDPTATINSICKFRAFIVFSTRTMAVWLITLATIDRWLISSMDFHRRHMSKLKNVQRGIIATIILSIISYIHMLYCYTANLLNAPLKCYGKSKTCCLATDMIYTFITIIIPLILMITFGLMTISNIHNARIRMRQIYNHLEGGHYIRRRDLQLTRTNRHLFRMLSVQILLLIVFFIPQAAHKFYITWKPFDSESELADVINKFLYNIELLVAFIASSMPFYVYTLASGTIFRQAFIDLVRTTGKKITCRSR
jgi:hypothetical protein